MSNIDVSKYTAVIADNIRNGGYTQNELAEKIDVAPSTLTGIMQSTRDPKLGTLIGLADVLGLSLDTLTGYTVPITPVPEVTELSPAQANQMEKSLIQLHSNLSAIGNYQQNEDIDKIIEYTQDCITQILNGQKLKEEKRP